MNNDTQMGKFEELYHKLTGTPYVNVKLLAHNHVVGIEPFKMENVKQYVKTGFGKFQAPDFKELIYEDNKYIAYYNITDFRRLKPIKKSIIKKTVEIIKYKGITIEYEPDINQDGNPPIIYVSDDITPQQFESMLENESLIAVNKPVKEDNGFGDLFNMKNILLMVGLGVAAIIGFNYLRTGRFL